LIFYFQTQGNTNNLLTHIHQGLLDTLAAGETHASQTGRRIILSKDFPGSDRDVHSRYMDAMALITRYGKPDFFVTMTSNPYWDEIVEQLLLGQMPQDRLDIVARVYKSKAMRPQKFP